MLANDPGATAAAVGALARGEVVAVPTDTVYGLAADPRRAAKLFRAKQRPRAIALPVLVADETQALELVYQPSDQARRLMARFWPGSLTLVLNRRPGLGFDLGDEDRTIGVRCPAHPVPLAICSDFGPMATTSANLHGQPALTTAEDLSAALGDAVDLVLDAGRCEGAPSTVVALTGGSPQLLRPGALGWATVLGALD